MAAAAPLKCRLATGAATPALDLVPSLGTTPMSLVRLARALVPAREVRAYAYRGIDDELAPHTTIEAIAAANVAELVAAAPHGPYLIAGHCLGGAVAYAMASALEARGERVAALVIIDAMAPFPPGTEIGDASMGESLVSHFTQIVESMASRALEYLPKLEPEVARRIDAVLRIHLDAGVRYRAAPLRAPLHVMCTADCDDAVVAGWNRLAASLARHTVAGDTMSMLRPPHVASLGRALGRVLAGAA